MLLQKNEFTDTNLVSVRYEILHISDYAALGSSFLADVKTYSRLDSSRLSEAKNLGEY